MVKALISLIMLSLVISLNSCEKDESEKVGPFVMNLNCFITVSNSNGDDLLDPAFTGAYLEDNIKCSLMIDSKKIDNVFDMDYCPTINKYTITTYLYGSFSKAERLIQTVILLELEEGVIEEIKCEIKEYNYKTYINKLWYKDKLVYDMREEINTSPMVNIVI